ncbi:MAG: tRNA (adenosine(37)-N6)-dimethylallyltransferase MiaA [Bryobacterales bacterium]
MSHSLIAVMGPTASGKSDLGIRLARELDGEVVNYDSVQIYRGFDVGSAKTPPGERQGVPHHLLDVRDAGEPFSAGEYARLGREVLGEIAARGKTPVIVGGTGFYLRALLEGLFDGPSRDEELRARLERKGAAHLHRLLARLDPESAGRIHPHDEPKLVRALEVRILEGQPLKRVLRRGVEPLTGFTVTKLLLDPPRDALYARIERRTEAMFDAGLEQEVCDLLAAGAPRDAWAFGALGYRQALALVEGRMSREEAIADTARSTRNYAKRQLTWFRNQEPEALRLPGFGGDADIQRRALDLVQ